MNIIFLDVDGVLNIMSDSYNSFAWVNHGSDAVEPHLMKRLEHLIENTVNAHIVVSSSWHNQDLIRVLSKLRFKYVDRIIGRTIRVVSSDVQIDAQSTMIVKDTGNIHLNNRGDQIQQWLNENELPIFNYVVLEDEVSDVCGERCDTIPHSNVVEVDMKEGLSHANIEMAIEILGR
jgi:hypothetical protein